MNTATSALTFRTLPKGGPALRPLGLGCAALGNLYAAVSDEAASEALRTAWSCGLTYFDTAPYYGHGLSETRLGRFLRDADSQDALVSTKVGRSLAAPGERPAYDTGFVDAPPLVPYFDYSRDGVLRQVDASLERLGRTRLDMAFVHDIGRATHGAGHEAVFAQALDGALPALAELKAQGVVGAIGIGVNEIGVCLETLSHADLDAILIAGRYTLLDQSAAAELLPVCLARGVGVIVGGPFNSGVLSGGVHYDYADAPPEIVARVQRLRAVCADHGVPLARAALQFPLRHSAVVSVIAGARAAAEVEANAAHMASRIPDALWESLFTEGLLTEAGQ